MPDRVRLRRTPGWRLPPGAVRVDQTTPYGNPFKIGARIMLPGVFGAVADPYHGTLAPGTYLHRWPDARRLYKIRLVTDRVDAAALFADWIRHQPGWNRSNLRALVGRDLACWCPLPPEGEPDLCHAAVLIEHLNQKGRPSA